MNDDLERLVNKLMKVQVAHDAVRELLRVGAPNGSRRVERRRVNSFGVEVRTVHRKRTPGLFARYVNAGVALVLLLGLALFASVTVLLWALTIPFAGSHGHAHKRHHH